MARKREDHVPTEADLQLSSSDLGLGEETPQQMQGQNRSPRQIESQAGRKPGFAKRTAGAEGQATRAARGGYEHKHTAASVEKKVSATPGRTSRRAEIGATARSAQSPGSGRSGSGGQKGGRTKRRQARKNIQSRTTTKRRAA